MAEQNPGSQDRRDSDILWVGRVRTDPYWARCAPQVQAQHFDNLYEALADVLVGRKTPILVINLLTASATVKEEIKSLLTQGLFRYVLVYCSAANLFAESLNGDPQLIAVHSPDQLLDRLAALRAALPRDRETGEVPDDVAESDSSTVWPRLPPSTPTNQPQPTPPTDQPEPKVDARQPAANEAPATPAPSANQELNPAELTPEELQALLGPEFKPDDSFRGKETK